MKTEELIRTLSQDATPAPVTALERRAASGLLLGGAFSAALFFWLLGPRPGLDALLQEPLILAKSLLPLALGVLILPVALRAARPAVSPGWSSRASLAVPVAAAMLLAWAFASAPAGERLALVVGQSVPVCLPAIPLMSLPLLAGLLLALKRGAPVNPASCGALAGVTAAGFAASLYSISCTEDTPLFYAVWYSVAIAAVAGLGAWTGARYLRW